MSNKKLYDKLEALADNYNLPSIVDWKQGHFINSPKYSHMGIDWCKRQEDRELTLIRPHGFTNNAIFQVTGSVDDAKVAEYLQAIGELLKKELV